MSSHILSNVSVTCSCGVRRLPWTHTFFYNHPKRENNKLRCVNSCGARVQVAVGLLIPIYNNRDKEERYAYDRAFLSHCGRVFVGAFIHGALDTLNVYGTSHPAALARGEAGAAKGQWPSGGARAELGRALPGRSEFAVRCLKRRNVRLWIVNKFSDVNGGPSCQSSRIESGVDHAAKRKPIKFNRRKLKMCL